MATAWLNLDGRIGLSAVALLIAEVEVSGLGLINGDSILVCVTLGLDVHDALLTEGDLLTDANISLDAEVSVLATLSARVMGNFLIRAASGLLVVDELEIGLSMDAQTLV